MKMTAFRVENFRSIVDSGWIDVDEITAIVGKNESGKTALFTALWKFKPYRNEPYNLDREWPRGNRKAKSPEAVVSTVRFDFTRDEQEKLKVIDKSAAGITGVEIKRNYKGAYLYTFLP